MRFVLFFCLTCAALVGCGGSDTGKRGDKNTLNDDQQLASLVTEFADTGDARAMSNYFAGGKKITPAEYKKYVALTYKMDGKPTRSGDTATGTVMIKSSNDDKDVGSREWSFAKEGEKWKIKDAPLP